MLFITVLQRGGGDLSDIGWAGALPLQKINLQLIN